MFVSLPREDPPTIAFVLVPRFSLIAYTCAIEPLRVANRLAGRELYRFITVSPDGQPVLASNNLEIRPNGDLSAAEDANLVLVCAGIDAHKVQDRELFAWLRRMDRRGISVGGLDAATYVLARAGMLEGYQVTIHWENIASFAENYPQIDLSNELFEIDGKRVTCAGGTAPMDMILNLIATQHGHVLAAAVADQFVHDRIRDQRDQQRMPIQARLGVRNPKLLAVLEVMERAIEHPLGRTELAARAGLSTRQLERLFRKYLHRSPARHYLELRLNRARLLLLETNMPIIDVALACGFVSASHFSKCYRDFFGYTPKRERVTPAEPPRPAADAVKV